MPRGTNTPGVEDFSQGDKTSGVTPKGDGVAGPDRRGWGGDGKSPSTRDTEGSRNTRRGEEIASGKDLAAPQIPHQGTAECRRGEVRPQRNPDGTAGARSKHSALAHREYGLLAPEGTERLAGNPAAAELQDSRDSPEDTSETAYRQEGDRDGGTEQVTRATRMRPAGGQGRGSRTP